MSAYVAFHTHSVDIDDALDFVDTLEYEQGAPVDHIERPADAVAWLQEHGLLHPGPDPRLAAVSKPGADADRAVEKIRLVRSALREVLDATYEKRTPDPAAVETVNDQMRAQQRLVLVANPDGCSLDHRHEGDPLDDALARISDRIARAVSGEDADRIKVCANDTCRWVFYDSSRTGRRRWCDMATCGNRAKAARHRARVKNAETASFDEAISAGV
jgi:predicted RNA-binding Zn ribbon-like protein